MMLPKVLHNRLPPMFRVSFRILPLLSPGNGKTENIGVPTFQFFSESSRRFEKKGRLLLGLFFIELPKVYITIVSSGFPSKLVNLGTSFRGEGETENIGLPTSYLSTNLVGSLNKKGYSWSVFIALPTLYYNRFIAAFQVRYRVWALCSPGRGITENFRLPTFQFVYESNRRFG